MWIQYFLQHMKFTKNHLPKLNFSVSLKSLTFTLRLNWRRQASHSQGRADRNKSTSQAGNFLGSNSVKLGEFGLQWVRMGQNWSQLATISHKALNVQSVTNCVQNWFKPGNIDEERDRMLSNIHIWWRWVFFSLMFCKLFGGFEKQTKTTSCYDPDMTIRNVVCSTEYIQMVMTSISPKL